MRERRVWGKKALLECQGAAPYLTQSSGPLADPIRGQKRERLKTETEKADATPKFWKIKGA